MRLFGATYSAHALSMELEMKFEMTGMFIMLGKYLDIGTTDIAIFGSPISVTRVVLTLQVKL